MNKICIIKSDDSPLITAAIHAGHNIRKELSPLFNLSSCERLREEDTHTDKFAKISGTHIIGLKSRFEVDLNRPPEKAVYKRPEDAWGLTVWKSELHGNVLERSLAEYRSFYEQVKAFLDTKLSRHRTLVLLDIHSYNHRRNGPEASVDDPGLNPDIDLGTGTMHDRNKWADIIDCCRNSLSSCKLYGRKPDVRENIKFGGGYFSKWINENYPGSVCCISIEFKKLFMDEWTGIADENSLMEIKASLRYVTEALTGKLIDR